MTERQFIPTVAGVQAALRAHLERLSEQCADDPIGHGALEEDADDEVDLGAYTDDDGHIDCIRAFEDWARRFDELEEGRP
jgi:hypothetical protein